ncbi:MAG TPA: DUF1353 domain-containing protein [Elusimicrobiota bacterium]|nr:DUF1353 domain-containing protein [Elusimicrobiota bacterium]
MGRYGRYVGKVYAKFLPNGRDMQLLKPFKYIDPHKKVWPAPARSIVDGASIPQFAWSIIGGPFEGKYREASVIHDVACDKKNRPWAAVHEMFYYAMRASGVGSVKAKIMYAAVHYFGPRWYTKAELNAALRRMLVGPVGRRPLLETGARMRSPKYKLAKYPLAGAPLAPPPPPPAPPGLTPANFKELQQFITDREKATKNQLSLAEIRDFRPAEQ